jgi:hypothetical protein
MVHQRIVVRELPDAFTDGTTVVTAYGESWLEDPHCLMRFGDTLVRTRCRTWHSSSLRFNAGSFEDDLNKLTTEAIGELMAARRTP